MTTSHQSITVNELVAQLKMDTSLNILFVEGVRDIAFWRKCTPPAMRKNSAVYTANMVIIDDVYQGGEKGKLLSLIAQLKDHPFANRIKIFVDADCDHLLDRHYADNVILTDFRDLESYAYNTSALETVVHTGLAKNDMNISELKKNIEAVCFPMGCLRLLSEKAQYKLSFSKTFNKGNRKKYIDRKKFSLKLEALTTSLLQNSGINLADKGKICSELNSVIDDLQNIDVRQILQGKDWLFCLAYFCHVDYEIEPLIFLGIDYEDLGVNPSIASVRTFLMH